MQARHSSLAERRLPRHVFRQLQRSDARTWRMRGSYGLVKGSGREPLERWDRQVVSKVELLRESRMFKVY